MKILSSALQHRLGDEAKPLVSRRSAGGFAVWAANSRSSVGRGRTLQLRLQSGYLQYVYGRAGVNFEYRDEARRIPVNIAKLPGLFPRLRPLVIPRGFSYAAVPIWLTRGRMRENTLTSSSLLSVGTAWISDWAVGSWPFTIRDTSGRGTGI
jgi:hypothetical protein